MRRRAPGFVRLAAHVLASDTRRHALLLAAVNALLLLFVLDVVPNGDAVRARGLPRLPTGIVPLLLGTVAALVVQLDGPARTRSLRHTLPLRPGAVLAARVTLVGIFLWAVPLAVQAAWFSTLGAGPDVVPLTADSAIHLAATLALCAAAGSVTRTPRDLLALALAAWGALTLVSAVPFFRVNVFARGNVETQLGWLLVGASILTAQSFSRRTRLLAAVGVIGLLATPILTSPSFREAVVPMPPVVDRPRLPDPPEVSARLRGLETAFGYERGSGRQVETLQAALTIPAPPGLALTLVGHDGRLAAGGVDRMLDRARSARLSRPMVPGSAFPTVPGLQPAPSFANLRNDFRPEYLTVAEIATDAMEELPPGALILHLTLLASEWRVIGRLAPEVGAEAVLADGGTAHVHRVLRSGQQVSASVGVRWSATGTHFAPPSPGGDDGRHAFALASPGYGTYVPGMGGSGDLDRYRLVGGAELREPIHIVEFADRLRDDDDPLPDDWFDDAELLVLERVDVGTFDVRARWEVEQWPTRGRPIPYRDGLEAEVTPEPAAVRPPS
jgi:hypothetical protein